MKSENQNALGVLSIRLLLGIIFFTQGYGKIFKFGLENVAGFFEEYDALFPKAILNFTLYFTSLGELIFGFTLILGLFRKITYIGLMLILLIVSFGHGYKDVIWDMQHVIYRAILLIPLFFIPISWDKIALDTLIPFSNKNK